MEEEIGEGSAKQRNLGTLKVFDQDLKIGEVISGKLADYLNNLVAVTSRGNRPTNRETFRSAINWILQTKKLSRIELTLNGNQTANYSIDVQYPKETVEGRGFTPDSERIEELRRPLQEFDEATMEKNNLDEYPVFSFRMSEEMSDGFPGFMSGLRRNQSDPKILEFEVKKLAPTNDESH